MNIGSVVLSGKVVTQLKLGPPEERISGREGKVTCTGCRHQFHRCEVRRTIDGFICQECDSEP